MPRVGISNSVVHPRGNLSRLLLDKYDGAEAAFSLERLSRGFGSFGSAAPQLNLTNNGVTQGSGIVGNAGIFEQANNDNLSSPNKQEFQVGSDLTVSTWVRFDSNSSAQHIVAKGSNNNNQSDGNEWKLFYSNTDDVIRFEATPLDGTTRFLVDATTFGSVPTDQWLHITARYDRSVDSVVLGVNGNFDSGSPSFKLKESDGQFVIGKHNDTHNPFPLNGKISTLKIWNGRYLSDSEVSTVNNSGNGLSLQDIKSNHANLLDDLVAAYEFEDIQDLGKDSWFLSGPMLRVRRDSDDVERNIGLDGESVDETGLTDFANGGDVYVTRWHDQTPTDIDVEQSTLSNQPRIVNGGTVESVDGRTAMHFDPSQNQYLASSSHPFAATELTFLCWAYRENDGSFHALIAKGNNDNNTRNLWVGGENTTNGNFSVRFQDTSGTNYNFFSNTGVFPTQSWTHIGARYDGSEVSMFVNGSIDKRVSDSFTPITDITTGLWVGTGLGGTKHHFDGYIDTPLLVPRALSDSDIQDIYNKTK